MLDGHLCRTVDTRSSPRRVAAFGPDMTVVTTAPSYLFWRCAPPELRVPREFLAALGGRGGRTVAVGPHGSATPGDDAAQARRRRRRARRVRGGRRRAWRTPRTLASVPAIAFRDGAGRFASPAARPPLASPTCRRCAGPTNGSRVTHHHHHRFDAAPDGPGAEVEASRGCPYSCTFCAKIDFRDAYRRRELDPLLDEIDGLIAPGRALRLLHRRDLPAADGRCSKRWSGAPIKFGVQTRIDLWKPEMLDLLGEAGCVSIEAGRREPDRRGPRGARQELPHDDRRAGRAADLCARARAVRAGQPDRDRRRRSRTWSPPGAKRLRANGVWANDPVPLYPYPGSPDYRRLWGAPDERPGSARTRITSRSSTASATSRTSDRLPLPELEAPCCHA